MNVWAVVPVKRFEAAKSRLSSVLGPAERSTLARGMLEHLLAVLATAPEIAGIAVVTDSAAVAALATSRGALALLDPPGAETLADRVDFALREVAARGATAALVLMSDLPELHAADVQMLVRELERVDVVVTRDTSGEHTNALGVHLGSRLPTAFGTPDSFRRHCHAAAEAGLSVSSPESPTLAFDVDTPEDHARLVRRAPRDGSSSRAQASGSGRLKR